MKRELLRMPACCAVRRGERGEFLDVELLRLGDHPSCVEYLRERARVLAERFPRTEKMFPVVRIARVVIQEVDEVDFQGACPREEDGHAER